MKPVVALTTPDDIPPVHVLVAAHDQDRKETEHLLAGFDRPGRGPKLPSPERDFVDYYAKKKGAGPESGRSSAPRAAASMSSRPPKQADVATVVRPRTQEGAPAWLVWVGAAILMLGIGGAVAYLATAETPSRTQLPTGPSAATTITAATPPSQSDRDLIPPPSPPDPTAASTTPLTVVEAATPPAATDGAPRPGSKRDPRGGSSAAGAAAHAPNGADTTSAGHAGAAAGGATKPPPRDDFIRDL